MARISASASDRTSAVAVRLPYAVFYDLVDEKITALRAYFPILALVQQLQTANVAS